MMSTTSMAISQRDEPRKRRLLQEANKIDQTQQTANTRRVTEPEGFMTRGIDNQKTRQLQVGLRELTKLLFV